MAQSVSVKATFGSSKRRFALQPSTTVAALRSQLSALFSTPPAYTILYEDDERDLVHLTTDEELAELFSIAADHDLSPLRIYLYGRSDTLPTAPPQRQQAAPTPPPQRDAPQEQPAPAVQSPLSTILSSVSRLLTALTNATPATTDPHHRHPRTRPNRWTRATDPASGPTPPPPPPPQLESALHRLQGLLSTLSDARVAAATGVFSSLTRASAATRTALSAALTALSGASETSLMRAAGEVFPLLRDFVRGGLPRSGAVDTHAAEQLTGRVREAVRAALGESAATSVVDLVTAALRDDAVLHVLQELRDWEGSEWDMELRVPLGSGRGRRHHRRAGGVAGFSVHRHVECDSCGVAPIAGKRYMCLNREDFDLCAVCYANADVNRDGLEFRECQYVWEAELADAVVPPPPLRLGHRGPHVAFLQKVLTDIGYMNESMYSWHAGIFGPNTRAAIVQVQREYELGDAAEEGVYDATTSASLASVVEAQQSATTGEGESAGNVEAGAGGSVNDAPVAEADPGGSATDAPMSDSQ